MGVSLKMYRFHINILSFMAICPLLIHNQTITLNLVEKQGRILVVPGANTQDLFVIK